MVEILRCHLASIIAMPAWLFLMVVKVFFVAEEEVALDWPPQDKGPATRSV